MDTYIDHAIAKQKPRDPNKPTKHDPDRISIDQLDTVIKFKK